MRVLVFGTFDRLHPGHEFLLREALTRGNLSVVVARDDTVLRIKGRRPQQSEKERARAIEEKFPTAHVLLGDSADYLSPVRTIVPDLILLGYDQELPPRVGMQDLPCPVERLPAFAPEKFKSSRQRIRTEEMREPPQPTMS